MRNSHKPSRRQVLRNGLLAASALLQPFALNSLASTQDQKMNVVLILVDDLGWSDLGCYGADLHETPHIDRLAAQSERFDNAYAASPVCTPTRASIMTGKNPARLNMTIWREGALGRREDPGSRPLASPITEPDLLHSETTIAEVLQQAGYRTAHLGKWHLGGAAHYPQTHGFDINIGGTLWGAPNTYWYPYRGDWHYGDYRYVPHLEFGEEGEYLTDRLTSEAIKVMRTYRDEPFFIQMAYYSVHTPIEGKPKLVEYYNKKRKEGLNHQNAAYAAMVYSVDENVGRILREIDDLGIADHTAVIFYSDNGGYINVHKGQPVTNNSPLRSGKGSLYEGGIRVPLMVRWPYVTKAGEVCHEPVTSCDLYPTLLDMLSLKGDEKHNQAMDGVSLKPVLRDSNATLLREALHWHYPHYYPTTTPVSAIRKGDWKLLEYYENGQIELYNLKDDIGESTDLSEKRPQKASELKKALDDWKKRVDAKLPTENK